MEDALHKLDHRSANTISCRQLPFGECQSGHRTSIVVNPGNVVEGGCSRLSEEGKKASVHPRTRRRSIIDDDLAAPEYPITWHPDFTPVDDLSATASAATVSTAFLPPRRLTL